MERGEIESMIYDKLEARFESYAQTQIALHEEYHKKMIETVDNQIQKSVNGKIVKATQAIEEAIKRLDEKTQPAVKTVDFSKTFAIVVLWICGAITAIGGAIMVIIKLKQWLQ